MADYGDATVTRQPDGTVTVTSADPVIGISVQLLAEAGEQLPVDESGYLLLAGDPNFRYRPVRFAASPIFDHAGPVAVLVCERVTDTQEGSGQWPTSMPSCRH